MSVSGNATHSYKNPRDIEGIESLSSALKQIAEEVVIKGTGKGWSAGTSAGEGGEAFDDREHVHKGMISRVDVWHDDHVNGLKMYYDGAPGPMHGSESGSYTQVPVPQGWHISGVSGRAGSIIDRIQFVFASNADSDAPKKSSEPMGGSGGGPFTAEASRPGLPLREIRGRAGSKIDALTLGFGYAFDVEAAELDEAKLIDQLSNSAELIAVDTTYVENESPTDDTVTLDYSVAREYTRRVRWDFHTKLMAGAEFSKSGSLAFGPATVGGSTKVSVSLELGFSYGQEETDSVRQTRKMSKKTVVPPYSRADVLLTAWEAQLTDFPMNYTVTFYDWADGVRRDRKTFQETLYISGPALSQQVQTFTKVTKLNAPEPTVDEVYQEPEAEGSRPIPGVRSVKRPKHKFDAETDAPKAKGVKHGFES